MKSDSRSFFHLIGHAMSEARVTPGNEEEADKEVNRSEVRLKRLAPSWTLPTPSLPCAPVTAGIVTAGLHEERPVFDWAGAVARHSGTVTHRYLHRIALEGVSEWAAERVSGERTRMEAMLRGLGLNGAEARSGAKKCVQIIIAALSDERGRWILSPHGEDAAEYALTGLVEGELRRVIIDRTFVDEKGLRWVIDYKTGEHSGGDLGGFLEREKERYKAQLEGYAGLFGTVDGEIEIRKALYYPAIPAWIEW